MEIIPYEKYKKQPITKGKIIGKAEDLKSDSSSNLASLVTHIILLDLKSDY